MGEYSQLPTTKEQKHPTYLNDGRLIFIVQLVADFFKLFNRSLRLFANHKVVQANSQNNEGDNQI